MTDEAKALVERLRDFVIAEDIDAAADRIETLEAENERLREALQKIANRAAALRHGTDDWFELVEFETVARAALGEKP